MESNVRILPPEELIPSLVELLEVSDSVPLVISGSSMVPFLVHHRDTVYLSKVRQSLEAGDMILYRRSNGQYVLHRIYRAESGTFILVGDAQTQLEHGIAPEQVLAVVRAVRRKGKLVGPGDFWWEFFRKVWIRIIPLRPAVVAMYSLAARLFPQKNGD